jgi:tryptophan-rich sensory protein
MFSDGMIRRALTVYGIQLGVNFLWSILFFNLKWYLFSFFWLLLLWGLILVTMILFFPIRKPAGWMLVPYVLWVTFAGYLNFGIFLLN